MGRRIVKLMNGVTRLRRSRCEPERLLILIPNCLQNSQCTEKVSNDVANCKMCGRCKVKEVKEISEEYGCKVAVATGGRLALKLAQDEGIDAVIAVACEKELQEGLAAVFPKPALGVINLRPHGPCTDTDVDLEELREAIEWFLR